MRADERARRRPNLERLVDELGSRRARAGRRPVRRVSRTVSSVGLVTAWHPAESAAQADGAVIWTPATPTCRARTGDPPRDLGATLETDPGPETGLLGQFGVFQWSNERLPTVSKPGTDLSPGRRLYDAADGQRRPDRRDDQAVRQHARGRVHRRRGDGRRRDLLAPRDRRRGRRLRGLAVVRSWPAASPRSRATRSRSSGRATRPRAGCSSTSTAATASATPRRSSPGWSTPRTASSPRWSRCRSAATRARHSRTATRRGEGVCRRRRRGDDDPERPRIHDRGQGPEPRRLRRRRNPRVLRRRHDPQRGRGTARAVHVSRRSGTSSRASR